jgi:hypothetical protein
MKPVARTDLATCNVRDELVVYDFRNHQARCLNRMAAAVFGLCDGRRTPRKMAAELGRSLDVEVDEEVVWLALGKLEEGGLLAQPLDGTTRVDLGRRRLLKKMALTAAASIALPAVWSVVAPTPAFAASGVACTPPGSCMGPQLACCNNGGMAGTCNGNMGNSCDGTNSICNGQMCQ